MANSDHDAKATGDQDAAPGWQIYERLIAHLMHMQSSTAFV
jgi:hypothetical protein